MLHPEYAELDEDHTLRVSIMEEDGEEIGVLTQNFKLDKPADTYSKIGDITAVPVVLNFGPTLPIKKPGIYAINILVDQVQLDQLTFRAMPPGAKRE